MNLNKVFLIGNLTRDPELRTLPSGMPVSSFGLATNRIWKNSVGEQQAEVQFHNVVVFGRQAEIVNQYLAKGSLVLVEGRIQTRSWEGKDGVKQYRTEIVAERIQFGPKNALRATYFTDNQNQDESGNGFRGDSAFRVKDRDKSSPANEELLEIDIDEENIKAEDLPF